MALPTPMLLLLVLLSALPVGLLCSPASAEEATSNVLFNDHGNRLGRGESLKNDQFHLTMQHDCNLVLLEFFFPTKRAGIPRWMSNTSREARFGCYLEVSGHGTLDIHKQELGGAPRIWSCGTPAEKTGSYALVLRADGRFGTYGSRFWRVDAPLPQCAKHRGVLYSGYDRTGKGTILRSGENELLIDDSNRLVTQIYGPDGKTVVFRHFVSPAHTFNGRPNFEFTTSGELVYSDLVGGGGNGIEIKHRVWGSGVSSNAVDHICALPDLGVYGLRQLVYNGRHTASCGVVLPQPRDGGLLSDE